VGAGETPLGKVFSLRAEQGVLTGEKKPNIIDKKWLKNIKSNYLDKQFYSTALL